jgi:hypothetical protein
VGAGAGIGAAWPLAHFFWRAVGMRHGAARQQPYGHAAALAWLLATAATAARGPFKRYTSWLI